MSVQAKNPNKTKRARNLGSLTGVMPIITLAVLVLLMTIGTRRFFTLSNITGMVEQGSTLLVMGLGQTFIILLAALTCPSPLWQPLSQSSRPCSCRRLATWLFQSPLPAARAPVF
jgi:hypothetical protein